MTPYYFSLMIAAVIIIALIITLYHATNLLRKKKTIIVEDTETNFIAYFEDDKMKYATGNSSMEAIGSLVMIHNNDVSVNLKIRFSGVYKSNRSNSKV